MDKFIDQYLETIIVAMGWLGAFLLLVAYFLVSFLNKDSKRLMVQSLNLAGSLMLVINTYHYKAYAATVLNAIWCILAIITMIRNKGKGKVFKKAMEWTSRPWRVSEDLHRNELHAKEHVDEFRKFIEKPVEFQLFNHLYECLNVLDNKCQSLMTIDSVTLVILSFGLKWEQASLTFTILYSSAFVLLIFCALLLLYLSFLKWVSTEDLRHPDTSMTELLLIRDSRTKRYRVAVWLSVFAIVIVTLGKVAEAFT